MVKGSMLVVVADGATGRFLSRARPGARLVELVDNRMEIGEIEPERDRPPRTNDSVGKGRHKIENRLTAHEAAEEAFLAQVADQAVTIVRTSEVAQLVLCAPPKALGLLRRALPAEISERIALTVDKDVTKETPAAIDKRLQGLKA